MRRATRWRTTLRWPSSSLSGACRPPCRPGHAARRTPRTTSRCGAKPVEVEGLAKPLAARVMAIAQGGQTLLTAARPQALERPRSHRAAGPQPRPLPAEGHRRAGRGVRTRRRAPQCDFAPPADADKSYRVVRSGDLWQPVREIPRHLPAERDAFVGRGADLQRSHAASTPARGWSDAARPRRHRQDPARHSLRPGLARRLARRRRGSATSPRPRRSTASSTPSAARSASRSARDDTVVQLGGRNRRARPLPGDPRQLRAGRAACRRHSGPLARRAPPRRPSWSPAARCEPAGRGGHARWSRCRWTGDAVELFVLRARARRRRLRARRRAATRRRRGHEPARRPAARDRAGSGAHRACCRRRSCCCGCATASSCWPGAAAAGRQATLRAAIDWSWDLLSPWEQAAFAQCSVFEGGFTLAAAEAVLDLAPWPDAPPVVDAVQALVDKSLLRRWVPQHAPPRQRARRAVFRHVPQHPRIRDREARPARSRCRRALQLRHGRYFAAFRQRRGDRGAGHARRHATPAGAAARARQPDRRLPAGRGPRRRRRPCSLLRAPGRCWPCRGRSRSVPRWVAR